MILCPCVCVCMRFIVMEPTDNFGYISLGACQVALMPVAQRYVIVLSTQRNIRIFIALNKPPEADRSRSSYLCFSILTVNICWADKLFESDVCMVNTKL